MHLGDERDGEVVVRGQQYTEDPGRIVDWRLRQDAESIVDRHLPYAAGGGPRGNSAHETQVDRLIGGVVVLDVAVADLEPAAVVDRGLVLRTFRVHGCS
jgi:hypothetical protein